ncbi:MAG: 16S rRNA (cytosine(1402)-N(4))-methyltransferase RsmH [Ruminococcaceae bacterium]|nr:16S rRNA (cytosine(1402)-N(4))-methyltransferase RsmH [Oscillospiraceae bacterium]
MEFKHISVLLDESVDALNINPEGIYADATLGGGGHSELILKRLSPKGIHIGIDRDIEAINAAKERLKGFSNIIYENDNYKNIKSILQRNNLKGLDGAIMDLGVSSYQLDNKERGFSYIQDAPLDMRMSTKDPISAYEVVNTYSEAELTDIFFSYGEEKFSKRIAAEIIKRRSISPIKTTGELSQLVSDVIPLKTVQKGSHPAKRVFQAIRIEVNGELKDLKQSVLDFFEALNPKARLAIITFHSLEDRIVKQTFKELAQGCTCPKSFPVCVCNNKPKGIIVSKKPVLPSLEETEYNSRSKSAKLRIIEKI